MKLTVIIDRVMIFFVKINLNLVNFYRFFQERLIWILRNIFFAIL